MTIVQEPTPRQTIPYQTQPLVRPNLRATEDFYQFLERLRVSASQTVQNITNIIIQGNANETQIQALQIEIDNLQNLITQIQAEIAALPKPGAIVETPPAPAPLPSHLEFPPWPIALLSSAAGAGGVVSFNTRTGIVVLLTSDIEALDLSTLPTSDPGGGHPWLNGGVMQVGP